MECALSGSLKETAVPEGHEHLNEDEQHLAELGYKQELNRPGRASPTSPLVLDHLDPGGLLHHIRAGLEQRRAGAISIGWPMISAFILVIGLCMSELVSAYPTSGGIYWWASKLGGPKAGYYTGWLNLIG